MIGVYSLKYDSDRKCRLEKEYDTPYADGYMVTEPKQAADMIETTFKASIQPEEFMYLICCDVKMRVKGLFIVSQGGATGTLQNMRGIFMRALLCNATNIIVVHNHPSGECEPSRKDVLCNEKLEDACELMEITLSDNIILGNGKYYSFKNDKVTMIKGGE